jgi:chromosome segregation ATPase
MHRRFPRGFAQYGILEWIRLENFMCHRCFEVKFGPNVNIISGPNGSGKSAIVAALQLLFGAVSASTDRGRRTGDLIRIGANSALVAVRLRNRRDTLEAFDGRFRPEIYGDAIVIHRRISRAGVSSWSFYDEHGKRVHAERSARLELEALVDHFFIQVSNPVAILTQRKSKEFLSSGKPADLYRFFMEATKLKEIRDALMEVRMQAADIRTIYGRKEAELPRLANELAAAKRAYDDARRLEHLEEELNRLRGHYLWACVQEAEEQLQKTAVEFTNTSELIEEGIGRIAFLERATTTKSQELENLNQRLREINEAITRDISEETNFDVELRQIRGDIRRLEQEKSRLHSLRAIREEERESVSAELEKLRERAQASDTSLVNHHQQLQLLMDEATRLSVACEGKRSILAQLETQLQALKTDQTQLRGHIQVRESALRQAERALVELQQSRRDPRVIFGGPHITAFLNDIDAAMDQAAFSRKPIGPLGSFLRIRDPKWALPIELCISSAILSAFVVHDLADADALRDLAQRKSYPIPRILVQNMDAPPYCPRAEQLPPPELVTVHSQIVIERDGRVLQNVLMDHAETELNLLFDTAEDARRAAFELRPRNVRVCWSSAGDRAQVGAGGSNQFRAGPDPSRYTPKLLGDLERQISLKRRLVENERREYELLVARETECEKALADFERKHAQTAQEIAALEDDERSKRRRIEALQESQEDEASNAFIPDAYQERIMAIDGELESVANQLEQLEEQIRSRRERETEIEKREQTRRGLERELDDKRKDVSRSCRALATEQAKYQAEIQALRNGIVNEQKKLVALNAKLDSLRLKVQQETDTAQQVAPRPEALTASSNALRLEIASLESRLQTEHRRLDGVSMTQLCERYEHAQQSYDSITTELGYLERLLRRIEDGLVERVDTFIQLRAHIQKHVSAYFGYYIHTRGHYGSIKFDDRSQEMRLRVAIGHHRTQDDELCFAQDLRSLSGGERSFTTLALMLALGEAMEVPFRIMDEFDVFMDEANRRVAYKTLIDIAKRESKRQFIFVTPLTLPHLRADPECVRIVRLMAPTRGNDAAHQTALDDFAQHDAALENYS